MPVGQRRWLRVRTPLTKGMKMLAADGFSQADYSQQHKAGMDDYYIKQGHSDACGTVIE